MRLALTVLTVCGSVAVTMPASLVAQQSVDISAVSFRVAGRPSLSAVSVSPQLHADAGLLRVWTAGDFALANSGTTRASLLAALSTRRPLAFGIAPVIQLRGQDDAMASDVRNRRIDGAIGIQLGNDALGATAVVGVARSVHGSTNRAVQTANADVHYARGAFRLRLGYAGNAFDASGATPGASSGFTLASTRLSDISSDMSWKYRGVELAGLLGRRLGGAADRRMWGGASASLTMTDRVALVVRQETAPADPTRHLPAQRLSTFGFRIRPMVSRARYDDGSDAAQFRHEFVLSRVQGPEHAIRVYLPDARDVEMAGSFNGWSPARMHRISGGWWELVIAVPPGMYTLNVRADGGRWIVPHGVTTTTDEFSGTVGVLQIP